MWRNMVEQVGGRAVLGTPFVGLLAAQILAETATGSDGLPGLMFNDGLVDGKRYSLRLQSPFGTDGFVWENGSFSATAPASTTYLLYEDNLLVPGGPIAATVGTPVAAVPTSTVAPTITGSAVQGSTLTASNGSWANSPTGYVRRWLRGASTISGAGGLTYVLQPGDVGSQIRVGVIATNATGSSAEVLSLQTSSVSAPPVLAPTNVSAPVISGSAIQGQTLSASNGVWANTPTGYAYRWIRAGATISGAASATYTLALGDVGSQIQVGVIASNGVGSSTESVSLQTSSVQPPAVDSAPPSLSGTIGLSLLGDSGYTITCPVATDAFGVTGYQYRIDSGAWVDIISGRSAAISGRASGVTDIVEMRAHDAALNYSAPLSRSITPSPAGSYIFPGGVATVTMIVPRENVAMLGNYYKQPTESLDYDIDFSEWLDGRVDTIGSIDVIVDTGIVVLGSAFSGSVVRIVLGGGVSMMKYRVTIRVATDAVLPIVREADLFISVKDI